MPKTKPIIIQCGQCCKDIRITIYSDPQHPQYNQPTKAFKSRRFCSRLCQKIWQQSTSWEDRVGSQYATQFREKMSKLSSEHNPSTFPGVAEKIGQSLSNYLKEHPRIGEKNPFFGCKHSPSTIDHWQKTKRGKRAYTQEQYEKSVQNTPKGAAHHNWKGGTSYGHYGPEFTRDLKKQIKESYSFTCQICETHSKNLDVHHIDYDKTNNSWDNLLPVCKVCHGKTNYNREEWIPICKAKVKNPLD